MPRDPSALRTRTLPPSCSRLSHSALPSPLARCRRQQQAGSRLQLVVWLVCRRPGQQPMRWVSRTATAAPSPRKDQQNNTEAFMTGARLQPPCNGLILSLSAQGHAAKDGSRVVCPACSAAGMFLQHCQGLKPLIEVWLRSRLHKKSRQETPPCWPAGCPHSNYTIIGATRMSG